MKAKIQVFGALLALVFVVCGLYAVFVGCAPVYGSFGFGEFFTEKPTSLCFWR